MMNKDLTKNYRHSERGSAGMKFMMVVVVLLLLGNAGLNYIPVAYQGENFKQEMSTVVIQGVAMPTNGTNPVEAMKARLAKAARENELPAAQIDVKQVNNVTMAHVRYT